MYVHCIYVGNKITTTTTWHRTGQMPLSETVSDELVTVVTEMKNLQTCLRVFFFHAKFKFFYSRSNIPESSLQNSAHLTTTVLPLYVQNLAAISGTETDIQQNTSPILFNLNYLRKIVSEIVHLVLHEHLILGNNVWGMKHDDVIKWKHFPHYWPGECPHKGQRRGAVFFHLCMNRLLSKQSWGRWFETSPRSLWRHCNQIK